MTTATHNQCASLVNNPAAGIRVLVPGLQAGGHSVCEKAFGASIGNETISFIPRRVNFL
jgi:hypothetical protein